jgi:Family of unknown function (DUF6084)
MPDLSFALRGVEVPLYAATPLLVFHVGVTNADPDEQIVSVALRCQIQLNATRRRYSPEAQARLVDVFGEPARWRETLRSLLWTHTSVVLPAFSGETVVDLPVACTYDFDLVATKYFDALGEGDIPLTFLFSGSVFYVNPDSATTQVSPISWQKEASYRLPVAVWQELVAQYYPNTAWLRLRKDTFDELRRYRVAHGFASWEDALAQLLQTAQQEARA